MEIGEFVGSLIHLRIKSHEGSVGNRCIELLPPCVVATFARFGKKVSYRLRLSQIEFWHPSPRFWNLLKL